MRQIIKITIAVLLCWFASLTTERLLAGSATWNQNPASNDWDTPENWTPATVPYGETDVATFGVSNITDVMFGLPPGQDYPNNVVGDIIFTEGAGAYTVTLPQVTGIYYASTLEFYDGGVSNRSGVTQNFVAVAPPEGDGARIYFYNSASAGENVVFTNEGGPQTYGPLLSLNDTASAGKATFY